MAESEQLLLAAIHEDGVELGLAGLILERILAAGFTIRFARRTRFAALLTDDAARDAWRAQLRVDPGETGIVLLLGRVDAFAAWQELMGAPDRFTFGSLRARFGGVVSGATDEAAAALIARLFPEQPACDPSETRLAVGLPPLSQQARGDGAAIEAHPATQAGIPTGLPQRNQAPATGLAADGEE